MRKAVAGRAAGNYRLAACVPQKDETRALSFLKRAQIVGDVWVFRRQRVDIADFDINFFHAGPFCARAKEPAPLSDDACSVERITRD